MLEVVGHHGQLERESPWCNQLLVARKAQNFQASKVGSKEEAPLGLHIKQGQYMLNWKTSQVDILTTINQPAFKSFTNQGDLTLRVLRILPNLAIFRAAACLLLHWKTAELLQAFLIHLNDLCS